MFTGKPSTVRAPKSDKPTLHFVESGETTSHSRNQTQYKPAKSTCSISRRIWYKSGSTHEKHSQTFPLLWTIIRYHFLIALPYQIICLRVTKRRHHFLEISDFINHAGEKRMQIRILVENEQNLSMLSMKNKMIYYNSEDFFFFALMTEESFWTSRKNIVNSFKIK